MKRLGKRNTGIVDKSSSYVYCSCTGKSMYYMWGVRFENESNN